MYCETKEEESGYQNTVQHGAVRLHTEISTPSLYPVMFFNVCVCVCVLADEDRAVDEEHRDAIAHRLREDVVRKYTSWTD